MVIKLFGITKEIIGSQSLCIDDVSNIHTVGDLKLWLAQQYPSLQKLTSLGIAVDSEYADDRASIYSNSEVALLPPVSGG